ncbi:class I SAM-dependent methyltransferase [Micromonospora lutea]|nr:class I SAM-dependent methyltransferase [Micromonospora lutea]
MPRRERLVRYWDGQAASYDRKVASVERRLLADSRRWVCQRATGSTLEVAVGTGLNLPYYPDDVDLVGVDWSPRMVRVTRQRAVGLGREMTLLPADAAALPFVDGRFDTVVSTFALCCVPDERAALAEFVRVLRPGGSLLLADHVVASNVLLRAVQHLVDLVSVPTQGEHYTRRPLDVVRQLDLTVVASERLTHGAIERVHARRTS